MRIAPRPLIGIVIFVAYGAVVSLLWAFTGLDYDAVAESSDTIVSGIVVPVGIGALLLAIVTSLLGWWRPAMREERGAGPRWGWAVPAILFVITLITIGGIDFGRAKTSTLVLIAFGTALVGFSEELLTRGLLIVGFRASLSEVWVWFWSSFAFGVLHALNLFFGQSLAGTVRQMVFAFVLGTVFYVTRRVTGLLVVTMVIHALWDFGILGVDNTDGSHLVVGNLLLYIAVILSVVLLVKILRHDSPEVADTVVRAE